MYDDLVERLRYCAVSDNQCLECKYRGGSPDGSKMCLDLLMEDAANAIEERDRYALAIQHEMMAEAESHIALVERLNKQVEELQKQVAHWQRGLAKSMCEVTLRELEKPRWIPVTERFPEMHEEVLVCNEDYGKTWLGFLEVAVWDGSDWICTWDMESRLHCITHWMTLPEPPKEERKDADS